MKIRSFLKLFYLVNILTFITACHKEPAPPFGGFFTVQLDTNQWEVIRQSENQLDEGPIKLLYRMKRDSGYFLDITIYNPQNENSMSSDSGEFFQQTNQAAGNRKNFKHSNTKVINNIHYQDSLFYNKGTLERAGFTGHSGKKSYIVLFNLFYNHRASNEKVLYNHESMTLEFEKILKSFQDLSS